MKKKMIATLLTGAMALSMVAGAATVMPSLTSTEQKVKRKTTSLIVVFQYRQKDKEQM